MIAVIIGTLSARGHLECQETFVQPAGKPVLRVVGGTDMIVSDTAPAPVLAAVSEKKSYTVAEFCRARHIELPMRDMQRMGKAAAKYSRELGLTIDRASDEMYGEVNAYCLQALEAIATVMCPAEMSDSAMT
jgi:fermentation-respiration switch protein FrsA (DUF1100 family)